MRPSNDDPRVVSQGGRDDESAVTRQPVEVRRNPAAAVANLLRKAGIGLLRGAVRGVQLLMLPLRRRRGPREIELELYRGYGNPERLHLTGRAVEATKGPPKAERPRLRHDLGRIYRKLAARPIAGAVVQVTRGTARTELVADENGFFEGWVDNAAAPDDALWHSLEVTLLEPPVEPPLTRQGRCLVAPPSARVVLISDIDDTVMFTGVASKLKMLWRLFAKPAESRVAFPGVAALYRAFHGGPDGARDNPILYVSRGPWSLYRVLDEFFELHGIPIGPVLYLRDWGISFHHPLPRRQERHKHELIEAMLEVYDTLPFVLVGDSGQRDPEIYAELAAAHPQRIQAVYIRDVSRSPRRTAAIRELAAELARAGADLVLSTDTLAMAEHAAGQGWIAEPDVTAVRRAVTAETGETPDEGREIRANAPSQGPAREPRERHRRPSDLPARGAGR
jgi:phosphatidate phosphatase APP1